MIVDNVLYSYHSAVDNVLPMLRRRSKGSYIGMAILCLVIKQVYSAYSVPNHLKRFPKVSFLAMIRSFLIKESVANRTKRLVTPLTNAGHGFYVVYCCNALLFERYSYKLLLLVQDSTNLDRIRY